MLPLPLVQGKLFLVQVKLLSCASSPALLLAEGKGSFLLGCPCGEERQQGRPSLAQEVSWQTCKGFKKTFPKWRGLFSDPPWLVAPPSLQDPRSKDAPPREHRCHRAWLAWIAPLLLAISLWVSCQAIVGLYNRKAKVINHITGCNEEFDPCNKPSNFYSHLLLFLQLPWSKDLFLKKNNMPPAQFDSVLRKFKAAFFSQ